MTKDDTLEGSSQEANKDLINRRNGQGPKHLKFFLFDMNQKYMKMTKDAILEGSSQQANKDLINRRNGQSPKHLKFFLLVFSKDEVQAN